MGFNSVAVIYNDHLGEMKDGGPASARIAQAIQHWSRRDRDPIAQWFGFGQIVSMAHADYSQVVVCGQNGGKPLADCNGLDWYALDQLADALRRHGWTVKRPKDAPKARKAPTP